MNWISIEEAKRIINNMKVGVGDTVIVPLGQYGLHRYRCRQLPELIIYGGIACVDSEECWEYVCEIRRFEDLTPKEIENNPVLKDYFERL